MNNVNGIVNTNQERDRADFIILNGTIYNLDQLQKELREKGLRAIPSNPQRTVFLLYKEFGPEGVKKIRGKFAIALWDKKTQQLFLARDHFGFKPLYYYHSGPLLIFSSGIKFILNQSNVKKEIDFEALSQYLSIGEGCIPAPRTIFKKIKKIPPGHYLIFKKESVKIRKYWDVDQTKKIKITFQDAKEKLLFLSNKSIRQQLKTVDQQPGVFLSGGIDSTIIASLFSQLIQKQLITFAIRFHEPTFDETYYIQEATQLLGSKHYSKFFGVKDLLETLSKIGKEIDEPLADPSLFPTYFLSEFTRQRFQVAFSGDGGDELFGGYPTYQAHKLYHLYQKLPLIFRSKIIPSLAKQLPTSFSNFSLDFKIKKFLSGNDYPPPIRHLVWMGFFTPQGKKAIFTTSIKRQLKSPDESEVLFRQYFHQPRYFDLYDRLQYLDFIFYLKNLGLVKTYWAGHLANLEIRSPFLTPEIAEFMYSLPSSFRIKGLTLKYLLRETSKKFISHEIISRPKKGFGVPIAKWIMGELKPLILEKLDSKILKEQNIFNPKIVEKLLNEHFHHQENNAAKIWALFMFQTWYENFIK